MLEMEPRPMLPVRLWRGDEADETEAVQYQQGHAVLLRLQLEVHVRAKFPLIPFCEGMANLHL
jgi:hypothetical protein